MEVVLTPAQENLINDAVREGRLASREDAVREAMDYWTKCEEGRKQMLADIAESEAQLERGEYDEINSDEEMDAFFAGVIERGKARLAVNSRTRGE